jgi:hypothetical protein
VRTLGTRIVTRDRTVPAMITHDHIARDMLSLRPVARTIDVVIVLVAVVGLDVDEIHGLGNPVAANPHPLVAVPVPRTIDPYVVVARRRRHGLV